MWRARASARSRRLMRLEPDQGHPKRRCVRTHATPRTRILTWARRRPSHACPLQAVTLQRAVEPPRTAAESTGRECGCWRHRPRWWASGVETGLPGACTAGARRSPPCLPHNLERTQLRSHAGRRRTVSTRPRGQQSSTSTGLRRTPCPVRRTRSGSPNTRSAGSRSLESGACSGARAASSVTSGPAFSGDCLHARFSSSKKEERSHAPAQRPASAVLLAARSAAKVMGQRQEQEGYYSDPQSPVREIRYHLRHLRTT